MIGDSLLKVWYTANSLRATMFTVCFSENSVRQASVNSCTVWKPLRSVPTALHTE